MELGTWALAIDPDQQQPLLDNAAMAKRLGRERYASVVCTAAEELVDSDEFWYMATALIAGNLAFEAPAEVSLSGLGNFKISIKIEAP